MVSGSSAFSKTSLNICKFMVHVLLKPGLENLSITFLACEMSAIVWQFEHKVPGKQKLFQEGNGIPVHLKGGIADAVLYRATMILRVDGMAYAIYQLTMTSFPKRQDWLQFILPAVT